MWLKEWRQDISQTNTVEAEAEWLYVCVFLKLHVVLHVPIAVDCYSLWIARSFEYL